LKRKIKDLSDEFKQYKICVSINKLTTSKINLRSIINDHIVGLINKSSNQSIDIFKKVVSNAEKTKNKINYDIERTSVIIRLLDNLESEVIQQRIRFTELKQNKKKTKEEFI
jgi:hypothetical protein